MPRHNCPESALCLGLQMFFVRKRSANVASAKDLRESEAAAAT
ncbi:hypothetical protein [Bacillus sp. RS11]